jgi:hypothetical protein
VRELSALYRARVAGAPASLPPLAIQYTDLAAWQRGWLQGEVLERQVAWWRALGVNWIDTAAQYGLGHSERPRAPRRSTPRQQLLREGFESLSLRHLLFAPEIHQLLPRICCY